MFIAIIWLINQALGDIFWKKSLWYWVWWKIHDLLGYPIWILIIIYFFITWLNFQNLDYFIIFFWAFLLILAVFNTQLKQKVYREERISVIIPYTNVNKILTIILSFFVFSDVSIISLFITIFAILIVIIFSINFKNLKLPKTISLLLLSESITALLAIWAWYLILNYWEDLYFLVYWLSWIIFLFILSIFLWQLKTLKNVPKNFWINRYIWSVSWIAWFLSLVVIKNLWLSITILLSFLGIWITLFLSYLILKDKPSKRDLLLTFIVTTLIWLWYYFK